MTMTVMTTQVMTVKQHNYIVDLAAKRPNWLIQLPADRKQTVTDVLVNEQIIQAALKGVPHPQPAKTVTLNDASKAISALLGVKPSTQITPTPTPAAQPNLKEVAVKWFSQPEAAKPAPANAPTPTQRLRQLLANFPDGKHVKFAVEIKGTWEFFSLDEVKSKYGNGGTYRSMRKLLGAPGGWNRAYMSVIQQLDVVRAILAVGWEKAAKDYATKHGRCARCDAHLSDAKSIAAKVGKDCADVWGWPW